MVVPFWFSIAGPDRVDGGAFLITKKYALTATHCLPADHESAATSPEPSEVQLVSETGMHLRATVSETIGDLALLEIRAFALHGILPPQTQRELVDKDSLWEAPYRPSMQHPILTGVVGNPNLSFRCEDGSLISAIQLTVSEGVGDHSGYSGGPVVTKGFGEDSSLILGMLLEQFPDQADRNRAANVLFAARLIHVWDFAAFEFDRQVLPHAETLFRETGRVLSKAEQILESAKSWSEKEFIDDHEYRDIKARVRDLVFTEESAGR